MIPLTITANLDIDPWTDLPADIPFGAIERIGLLPNGTAPRSTQPTGPEVRERAAEYLRGLAPPFTNSLAEAAKRARVAAAGDPGKAAHVDAAIRLLNLELIGDPS